MINKQIENLKQVFFGNHIEQKDLNELKDFLKVQLNTIERMQGIQEKTIQLIVYKEKLNHKGFMVYTCKLVVNNQIMLLKNDTSIFKCINRVNKKDFSLTIFKVNLRQFLTELEKMYDNKIELIKLV